MTLFTSNRMTFVIISRFIIDLRGADEPDATGDSVELPSAFSEANFRRPVITGTVEDIPGHLPAHSLMSQEGVYLWEVKADRQSVISNDAGSERSVFEAC